MTSGVSPCPLRSRRPAYRHVVFLAGLPLLVGCQELPIAGAGSLQTYDALAASDGLVTKSRVYVDKPALAGARRLFIVPTNFSAPAAQTVASAGDRRLIANAIDRALCANLSEKFEIVGAREQADLTVRAAISHIALTDEVAAGVSKGLSVAGTALGGGLVPRLPYGLGSLSVEAEALDTRGRQRAAMVWARGAGLLGSEAAVSDISDAYQVAGKFGEDFGQMLVTGESPFGHLPGLMSSERINLALGLPPSHSACAAYGRGPGVAGALGSAMGLPPDVTDRGTGVFE